MTIERLGGDLFELLLLVVVVVAAFGFAVWFGRQVLAPRIGHLLDRAETKDDDDRDN